MHAYCKTVRAWKGNVRGKDKDKVTAQQQKQQPQCPRYDPWSIEQQSGLSRKLPAQQSS